MSRTKQILSTVSFIIFITNITFADWREDAQAVDISGGEAHTLVLTKDKWPWACGSNGWYQLGTGDNDNRLTLVRVHGGDMGSSYLQDINDVDAGWKHSLALEGYHPNDPNYNGYVWAWGWNSEGQLGDNQNKYPYSEAPVQVLRGEQVPADSNDPDPNLARIIDISAGRSGEHSLAVDANGYAYAWGRNEEGQLGNGGGSRKLTPVHVWRGEQEPEDPCNPDPNLARIIAVSAGEWHSMGLERYDPCDPNMDGRVYTWGEDAFYYGDGGVLGIGDGAGNRDTPVCVLSGEQDPNNEDTVLEGIVAISAASEHSMALEKDDPSAPNLNLNGRVYTWGYDGNTPHSDGGRLGNGQGEDSNSTPVLVLRGEQPADDPNNPYPYLSHITAVSAGAGSSGLWVNASWY